MLFLSCLLNLTLLFVSYTQKQKNKKKTKKKEAIKTSIQKKKHNRDSPFLVEQEAVLL